MRLALGLFVTYLFSVGAEHVKKTPDPVRCGDKVGIRAEFNFKFLNIAKDLSVKATTQIPGIGEIFVVECRTKKVDEVIEFGDTVLFKGERSGKYLNDGASDTVPVSCDPEKARGVFAFAVFDPKDDQVRAPVLLETPFTLRSMRPHLMTYLKVQGPAGNILANSDNTDRDTTSEEFRLYKFPDSVDNYASACPTAENGKVCSGNGLCIDRGCDCNDNASGEFCEHLRLKAECSLVGDLHVESFDGGLYNCYELGEFLMYQEAGSTYHEAVAGFITPWDKKLHTGVLSKLTVRRNGADGEEFLTFDEYGKFVYFNCDQNEDLGPAIKAAGTVGVTLRNGLNVIWANSMWEVNSPSRLRVRVRPRPDLFLLDVFIGVDTPRLGTAEGLCGNNDGKADNDAMPRMTERTRNEPNMDTLAKLRVEDGRDYPSTASALLRVKGVDNGNPSRAFYQCKAKTTYVEGETTLLAMPNQAITVPDDLKNQVRTSVETGLDAGFCAGSVPMQESSAACCRQVLVKARAIGELDKAPMNQFDLDFTVTPKKMKAAWGIFENAVIPDAVFVKGDYIQCIEDVCKTRTSKFCAEEKQDVEIQRNIRADDIEVAEKEQETAARQARQVVDQK